MAALAGAAVVVVGVAGVKAGVTAAGGGRRGAGGVAGGGGGRAAMALSWAFTSSRRAWTRAARSALSSRMNVSWGVLRRRIFLPTSLRRKPRWWFNPSMAPVFCSGEPKTETKILAWVKSEVTSTPRMVTKPGRGSRRPRTRRSPRTFWISSATRAVRMDMPVSEQTDAPWATPSRRSSLTPFIGRRGRR